MKRAQRKFHSSSHLENVTALREEGEGNILQPADCTGCSLKISDRIDIIVTSVRTVNFDTLRQNATVFVAVDLCAYGKVLCKKIHIFGISAPRSIGISQKFSVNVSRKGKQTIRYYGISYCSQASQEHLHCFALILLPFWTWMFVSFIIWRRNTNALPSCSATVGNTVVRGSLFSLQRHISRELLRYSDRSRRADSEYVYLFTQNFLLGAQIDCDKNCRILSQCVKIDGANAGDDISARGISYYMN